MRMQACCAIVWWQRLAAWATAETLGAWCGHDADGLAFRMANEKSHGWEGPWLFRRYW